VVPRAVVEGPDHLSRHHGTLIFVEHAALEGLSRDHGTVKKRQVRIPGLDSVEYLCFSLPTEKQVESGTSQSKNGTSVDLSNSGKS